MADRRKELRREYKETPRPMGVYVIRNVENGKCFVASSRDIPARLQRHQFELRNGSEAVKDLLAEWREFGDGAFVFEALDVLEPLDTPGYDPRSDLAELERMWLEKLEPYGENGYNPGPERH
ncbi:MAG: GIY-YIG nuclease family protein [Candidatus Eisenbacteria bacterium]